jgi:hypothetical protein
MIDAKEILDTIQPFVVAGGQGLIKGAAADLWTRIKSVFKKKEDEDLLRQFEDDAKNSITKGKLEMVLNSEMQRDQNIMTDLAALLEKVKLSEEYRTFVNQVGDKNISVAGKISNSSININKS